MKIRKGDKVKIITGKDKGAEGIVEKIFVKKNSVLIDGVNVVTKHIKPRGKEQGGIVRISKPVNVSNVMILEDKKNMVSRISYKIVDGKKFRVFQKSKEIISLEENKK